MIEIRFIKDSVKYEGVVYLTAEGTVDDVRDIHVDGSAILDDPDSGYTKWLTYSSMFADEYYRTELTRVR